MFWLSHQTDLKAKTVKEIKVFLMTPKEVELIWMYKNSEPYKEWETCTNVSWFKCRLLFHLRYNFWVKAITAATYWKTSFIRTSSPFPPVKFPPDVFLTPGIQALNKHNSQDEVNSNCRSLWVNIEIETQSKFLRSISLRNSSRQHYCVISRGCSIWKRAD